MISDNESTRAQKLVWVPPLTTAGRAEEWVAFFFFFLIILFIFGCAESPLPWGGYSLVVVHGLLTAVVSLVAHGL